MHFLAPPAPATLAPPAARRAEPWRRRATPALAAEAPLTRDFSGLFEAHAALVHRTAWRVTGRAEDAEDVLQSVFLHVLRKPPEPWPDDPAAYLHRSAVNASIDLVRGRKRRAESGSDALDAPEARPMAGPGAAEDTALGHLDGERLARRLRAALPQLSPFEAEVFSLRFFEGMSNTEVASLLGKTANHVGVTLHSARTKLRTELFPQTAEASHD